MLFEALWLQRLISDHSDFSNFCFYCIATYVTSHVLVATRLSISPFVSAKNLCLAFSLSFYYKFQVVFGCIESTSLTWTTTTPAMPTTATRPSISSPSGSSRRPTSSWASSPPASAASASSRSSSSGNTDLAFPALFYFSNF